MTGRTLADIAGLVVAIWFLLSPDFADLPAKRLLDAVALFVAGLSAWRIVQRLRKAP